MTSTSIIGWALFVMGSVFAFIACTEPTGGAFVLSLCCFAAAAIKGFVWLGEP